MTHNIDALAASIVIVWGILEQLALIEIGRGESLRRRSILYAFGGDPSCTITSCGLSPRSAGRLRQLLHGRSPDAKTILLPFIVVWISIGYEP
jgi:hypothetical protein